MARIPDDEIERFKRETDLVALVQSKGIECRKHGSKDLSAKCPFHADDTASFIITPEKNVWHCMGCGAGGSVFDFVMKYEGVSFRHAYEILSKGSANDLLRAGPPVKRSKAQKLKSAVALDADDYTVMAQVIEYYHKKLKETPAALEYLHKRGITDEAIETFQIGFADRTLGLTLPSSLNKAGQEIRPRLKKIGILREESGHEHFTGCVTFPIQGPEGITEVYGRRLHRQVRGETQTHLYLPGPHRGIFNPESLQSREIILCESVIDALTFWCVGFRNVTCIYGTEGFKDELMEAFIQHKTQTIYLAYDRDQAGDRAAERDAARFLSKGIECYRVKFPQGMDANEYARKVTPAQKSLGLLLRSAEWLGKGQRDARPNEQDATSRCPVGGKSQPVGPQAEPVGGKSQTVGESRDEISLQPVSRSSNEPAPNEIGPVGLKDQPVGSGIEPVGVINKLVVPSAEPVGGAEPNLDPEPKPKKQPVKEADPSLESLPYLTPAPSSLLAASKLAAEEEEEQRQATNEKKVELVTPMPPVIAKPVEPIADSGDFTTEMGERQWRVRGLDKNTSCEVLRVNLRLWHKGLYYLNVVDLYQAKQRQHFIEEAAKETLLDAELIKRDLGKLLLKLEELQEERTKAALALNTPTISLINDQEREQALKLLREPNLLDRILKDFDRCGIVGEKTNKLCGYLASVSRKLEKPLAIIIQSTSAAGKSSLMDAILSFIPPEEKIKYSAMTGQSLYYLGEKNLKHKILAIVEEEGAEKASYALKLLQSEGELTIASTSKDDQGRMKTEEYRVEGPVMIILTTTAIDIDEELLNRCIVLTVDESREQTNAIHHLQREAETLAGLEKKLERDLIWKIHQNAQRLLRPIHVVNPFAPHLTFLSDRTRTRRDHMKYLTLIRTVTLLHQHQRELKTLPNGTEYIEVTLDDIKATNEIAHEVLGRSLDELPPQTRKLLSLLEAIVKKQCEGQAINPKHFYFSRRQVREWTGWGNTQLKIHLGRLEDFEYLAIHRSPHHVQGFLYELRYDGKGTDGSKFLPGLVDPSTLNRSGSEENQSGTGRPLVGGWSAPGRDDQNKNKSVNQSEQNGHQSGVNDNRSAPGRPETETGRVRENPENDHKNKVDPVDSENARPKENQRDAGLGKEGKHDIV